MQATETQDPNPADGYPNAELPGLAALQDARQRVYRHLPPTPQFAWPTLSARFGRPVWVKHENHSPVGAFKLRGGLVYVERLLERQRPPGLISATRGNHGQSIGFAARAAGLPACIVVPHGNSREKNAAMRALGVELIEHGDDFQAAREHAGTLAAERGWHPVPSFHPDLVAGVASYWLEFLEAMPTLRRVYVPIGLGSGACAAIAARNALGLGTEIVGVISSGARTYRLSLQAGHPVESAVTTRLGDGMAVRLADPQAVAVLRAGLHDLVEVDDDAIAEAMRVLFLDTHNVAEGAGAAGLAAAWAARATDPEGPIGVVCTGGNVDHDVFARVLTSGRAPQMPT